MRFAKALKYMGLLVSAEQVDHSAYKDLGLVCQNCSQPVFLVASRHVSNELPRRTRNGKLKKFKPYITDPYFAHFNCDGEPACSLSKTAKTSQPNSSYLVASQSLGRNQRLKVFESRLQQILSLSPQFSNSDLLETLWLRGFTRLQPETKVNSYLRQRVAEIRQQASNIGALSSKLFDDLYADLNCLDYLDNSLEVFLHQQICQEAIDYLLSPAGYSIASWLYTIAEVNAQIYYNLRSLLLEQYGSTSSEFNTFAVYGRYLLLTAGVFGLLKLEFVSQKHLEKSFNNLTHIKPPSELLLELFASSVALTPWREGFDRPVDKAFPTEIHAFFVTVYQSGRGGYFIVDAGNNIFRFDNGRKLDLSAWFFKNINPFTKPAVDSNAPLKIDLSLPEPFQNLKIRVDMPTAEPIDSTATFTLLKHNILVAELIFWRKIDSQRVRKSLLKRYGKLDKQEQKLLFAGPSAIASLNNNEKKYGHILLSALNCFICFQNACVSVVSKMSDVEKKPSFSKQ